MLLSKCTTIAREQPAQPYRQTISEPREATAIHFLEQESLREPLLTSPGEKLKLFSTSRPPT